MKLASEIIIAPVITEKSMAGSDMKKYTFKVAKDATKIDIKYAVAQLFNLKANQVAKVNTINVRGHFRRYGRFEGKTASWKKAVVTLTADAKPIEFFEGMM